MTSAASKLVLAPPTFIPLGPVKEVSHLNALPGTTDEEQDVSDSESVEYTNRRKKKKSITEKRNNDQNPRRGSVFDEFQDRESRRNSFVDKDRGSRRSSVVDKGSRRSSVVDKGSRRGSVADGYGERRGSVFSMNSKTTLRRRHSMLEAVRRDLQEIVSIPALRKYRKSSEEISTDDEENDIFSKPGDFTRERKRSFFQRPRRNSSISSDTSDTAVVTDYEMRKIKMLQTLESMGIQRPRKSGYSSTSEEVNILENMSLRRKPSLNSRLLEGTKVTRLSRPQYRRASGVRSLSNSRNSSLTRMSRRGSRRASMRTPSSDRSGQPTPDYMSDQETTKEQRDTMQKVVGIMKSSNEDVRHRSRSSISGTDLASQSIGIFRRKLLRKRGKFNNKFIKLAKFLVVLLRAWKIHSQSVNKILQGYDSIDALAKYEGTEKLMFDVSDFKASKEARIPKKFRELLEKRPSERTKEDLHYLKIALRNYKSIVEYPVGMQKLIAERCWYETFGAKRVIVREGRIPMAFYFILSGSAVVTAGDPESGQTKTVMFLNRGDSFGEQAITTRSLRQTTVISREKIELLVMSDTDFIDIFMSGGLRDPKDPFLRSLDFLEGWPIELLAQNPSNAIFSFFKRGTVLVNDSNNNDWIFVVKSGSCSLLKKLKSVNFKKRKQKPKKKKEWREELEDMMNIGKTLSHEEQVDILHHQEIRRLEEENITLRYYALPEINVATNAVYAELRQMHSDFVNQNTLTRALDALQNMDEMSVTGSVLTEVIGENTHRKMSLVDLGELVAKGPFLAKGEILHNQMSASTERHPPKETSVDESATIDGKKHVTIRSPSASTIAKVKSAVRPLERDTQFVNIRTLTKGQHFGLEDIIFKDQGSFSLVSNGVEVIMINKKLYLDNLDHNRRIQLNDKIYPYPSDDDLQHNLEDYMYWEFHKKHTFQNSLRHNKLVKIKPHDSRAILEVPPVI